jgi:hypothetical protein
MMAETQIRFEDGLSYERYMGDWSRRVGTIEKELLQYCAAVALDAAVTRRPQLPQLPTK